MRHLSKQGIAVKKLNKKLARHTALLTVNAHVLRRFEETLPKALDARGLRWLNERLALMNQDWLDELTEALTGQRVSSGSRTEATRRCVEAVEHHAGVTFPEPKIYTTEGMAYMETTDKSKLNPAGGAPAPAASPAGKATKKKPAKKTAAKKAPGKPPAIKPDLGRAKAKARAKAAPKPRAHDGDEDKLTVLTPGRANPKKKGTKVYDDFQLMLRAKTVGEYRKLGGSMVSLRDDVGRGHVRRG